MKNETHANHLSTNEVRFQKTAPLVFNWIIWYPRSVFNWKRYCSVFKFTTISNLRYRGIIIWLYAKPYMLHWPHRKGLTQYISNGICNWINKTKVSMKPVIQLSINRRFKLSWQYRYYGVLLLILRNLRWPHIFSICCQRVQQCKHSKAMQASSSAVPHQINLKRTTG